MTRSALQFSATEKKLFLIFVIWRLSLFVIGAVATLLIPFRPGFGYASFTLFSNDSWVQNVFVQPWANFDGVHYLLIARNGYDHEARFFPLYPLTIRGANFLTAVPKQWVHADFILVIVGLVISNLAFVIALLIFHRLIKLDYSNKIAFWSCVFLMLFPTSFFFVSVYAESLFLLLSCSAFYLARKRLWFAAALCAAFASATRVVGIFLFPALIIEYLLMSGLTVRGGEKSLITELKKIKQNIFWLLLAPVGLVMFVAFNQLKWGRWDMFVEQQAALGNSRSVSELVDPIRVSFRYMKILLTVSLQHFEWWTALTEFISFLIGLVLCFSLWRQKIRWSYVVYALGCFFLPVISGTLTGLPRYLLVIFPFFLVLGMIRHKPLRYALIFICSVLMTMLTMLFSRGYFVA